MTPARFQDAALYVAWKLPQQDVAAPGKVHRRLSSGQARNLYRLQSWVIAGGQVQALLSPTASLDRIATALWDPAAEPLSGRWVSGPACADLTRRIETTPVHLGLAARPEQWPWSSAAAH